MELLKRRPMVKISAISICICFFVLLSVPAMAGGPWKGKIIDIETKEPLEGAVVLAVWERVYRTPAGPNSYFHEAKEVLTDKEGRFEISSYTPINLLPLISYIRGPNFTFFKPGYLSLSSVDFGEFFLEGSKEAALERKKIGGQTFRFAPGVLELPRLKTREVRLKNIPGGPTDVSSKKLPLFYKAINEERNNLGLQGEVWR